MYTVQYIYEELYFTLLYTTYSVRWKKIVNVFLFKIILHKYIHYTLYYNLIIIKHVINSK